MGLHRLFGLAVDSELPLPLPALDPTLLHPTEAIVQVRRGAVALDGEKFWQAPPETPFAGYRSAHSVILDWPEARFRVEPNGVVVEAADEAMATVLLLQGVWSVLLSARGQETLHASAFARGGAAVAVAGASGSGKSTIGLALHRAGWLLVSDDLLAFDATRRVFPGPPFIRLTSDRWENTAGEIDATGKRRCRVPVVFEPTPLAAVFVHDPNLSFPKRLTGRAAVDAVLSNAYNDAVPYPGQGQRRFELAVALATCVPMHAVPPRSLTIDQIESAFEHRGQDGLSELT